MAITVTANEKLSQHTTFGIGGPARYYTVVTNAGELDEALNWAKQHRRPYFVLGHGSNLLVSDRGYAGLVIHNRIDFIRFTSRSGTRIEVTAGSGTPLARLITETLAHGYTDLIPFSYIPGTVGGAVYNNAHYGQILIGAYLTSARILDHQARPHCLTRREMQFGYDRSILQSGQRILTEATFILREKETATIQPIQSAIRAKRQRYPARSAGCIFRNLTVAEQVKARLTERSVGWLIDHQLGLKGKTRGQAMISLNHAAFIENRGHATAAEVLYLMRMIAGRANRSFGLRLRPEITLLGFTKKELTGII